MNSSKETQVLTKFDNPTFSGLKKWMFQFLNHRHLKFHLRAFKVSVVKISSSIVREICIASVLKTDLSFFYASV